MESSHDDRLGEIVNDVKAGFARVDARFEKVEGEMKVGFAELQAASERLYRMLLGTAVSVVVTLVAALAAVLTT